MKHAFKNNRQAFTLLELIVGLLIVMLIYASFSRIFSSSGQQIEKSSRMLELQGLLDSVEHCIREDVRKLKRVELSTEANPGRFCFMISDADKVVRLEYEFIAARKGILRRELSAGAPTSRMLGEGHILACVFEALVTDGQFKRLDLAMNLHVDSNAETADRDLSVIAHFTSRCTDPYLPWLAAP
ncbi:MAG TPA: type II secretion system protein [Candidatus Rifleibacterium sp.]|nr:type II secretion system protein [Candidatus Rifleibacterium sp.]